MQTSLITKLAQNGQIKSASPMYLTSEAAQPSRVRFTNAVNSMLQEEREREAMSQESFRHFEAPHIERYNFPKVTLDDSESTYDEYATDGVYHAGRLKPSPGSFKVSSNNSTNHSGHLATNVSESEIRINVKIIRIVICIIVATLSLVMFFKIMAEEKRLEMLVYQVSSMRTQ